MLVGRGDDGRELSAHHIRIWLVLSGADNGVHHVCDHRRPVRLSRDLCRAYSVPQGPWKLTQRLQANISALHGEPSAREASPLQKACALNGAASEACRWPFAQLWCALASSVFGALRNGFELTEVFGTFGAGIAPGSTTVQRTLEGL